MLFLSNPKGQSGADRRRIFDAVKSLNQTALADVGDPEIATRISQYEMAYRMQTSVPDLMDISQESASTLEMYGATPGKATFSNNCLLARRLVERGVRVVELYDADWDHHGGLMTRLPQKCRDIDQGMSALIKDLKQRGMLDDTLVIWGSEFGRTPLQQGASSNGTKRPAGRDHHKDAYTMWMAGGGVKGGQTYGSTTPLGFDPAEKPVHVHDLNATMLHLLGIDHEKLTFALPRSRIPPHRRTWKRRERPAGVVSSIGSQEWPESVRQDDAKKQHAFLIAQQGHWGCPRIVALAILVPTVASCSVSNNKSSLLEFHASLIGASMLTI